MSIDPPQQEAEVTDREHGEVTFQGTVEVDQPAVMTSTLNITAVMNTGWPTVIEPSDLEVTGPATVEFELTVVVPPATSSFLAGNLMATARLKAPLMAAIQCLASAIVTVAQYHKVRIDTFSPIVEAKRGEERKVEMSVYNDGNGLATMRVSVQEAPEGVNVGLSESQFSVHSDDHHEFEVFVDITGAFSGEDGRVIILVEDMGREGDVELSRTYTLFVKVETISSNLGDAGPLVIAAVVCTVVAVVLFFLNWRRRQAVHRVGLPPRPAHQGREP